MLAGTAAEKGCRSARRQRRRRQAPHCCSCQHQRPWASGARAEQAAPRGCLAWLRQWRWWIKVWGVDRRDSENRTPLHLACANGHTAVVNFLLGLNCKLNPVDNFMKTPLMRAVEVQKEDCVAFLLVSGARINMADADGNTALHLAVRSRNVNMVRLLLDHHANPVAKIKEGQTPLSMAVSEHQKEIADCLLNRRPRLQPRDDYKSLVQTDEDNAIIHGFSRPSQPQAEPAVQKNTAEAPAGGAQDITVHVTPQQAGAAGSVSGAPDVDGGDKLPAMGAQQEEEKDSPRDADLDIEKYIRVKKEKQENKKVVFQQAPKSGESPELGNSDPTL
ncbi:putative ankyrin repeat domain-containing protein 30B-like [Calypte anna]|uniref:putative ankyrin repeat domain-containing protein 30B-like n=1 Tax=Calypte anna TaxID=9244 RepID=UPI0011C4546E|nr:putative ankyrin repeat domain-containing protein 30B-like [Calypte anna]